MEQSLSFKAERIAAQHCAELTAPRRSPPDHAAGLSRFGRRVAQVLPGLMAAFCDDVRVAAACGDIAHGSPADMLQREDTSLSHVVLSALAGDDFVLSIDRRAVFELLDRAFGGDGRITGDLPDTLPLSGQSILARLERALADAVAALAPAGGMAALTIGRRESDPAMLRAFPREERVHRIALSIQCGETQPWTVLLSMRSAMAELLADAHAEKPRRSAIGPQDAPFADIPLRLNATLIDMRMPLSRLSGLRPGDLIPVSVARSVPLALSGKIVAHGTVGEIDDRVALQITSAFSHAHS